MIYVKDNDQDIYDIAILYDSNEPKVSDINYSKIAQFYGLQCKKIDLSKLELQDNLLKDNTGNYLKGIGISAFTLESRILNFKELSLLNKAVGNGLNLLIYDVSKDNRLADYKRIKQLTNEKNLNVTIPIFSTEKCSISDDFPEITGVFAGAKLKCTRINEDFYMNFDSKVGDFDALISLIDNSYKEYYIFIRFKKRKGSIFLLSSKQKKSLEEVPMQELYSLRYFTQIVPVMMFVRYAGKDACWHRDKNYANLTIDDPCLSESYGYINFKELLSKMEKYNFHTTIAFIPWNYDNSQPEVVKLFLDHPDRFSLVIHGNNHSNYEFKESVSRNKNKKDILEALNRMEEHKKLTSISYGKIMVFPYGICHFKTLEFLKKYNFKMSVNDKDVPLGLGQQKNYDYGMRPAIMDYASFPLVVRQNCEYQEYIFDLFLGKPVIFFAHHNFFAKGIDAFNSIARTINNLASEVEWRSLGDIAKLLYLEKINKDGSIEVQMFSNELILSNRNNNPIIYRIHKKETLNISIAKVTINREEVDWIVKDGLLRIDMDIPANESAEINITYSEETPQITKFPSGLFSGLRKAGIRIYFLRWVPSRLRDKYLLSTKPGKAFASLYYKILSLYYNHHC